jgi:opacity protein-like surface antigen
MKGMALAAVALLVASPAFAQQTEISLLGGYTTSGDIDRKAVGIETLEVAGGFNWGVVAGRFFTHHWGAEASFSRQGSDLVIGTSAGSAELFDMTLGLLHGSAVYQFGSVEAAFKPFVLAGLGATFLSAEDLESETKFSWTVGAGIKWFPSKKVGGRVQARYAPTSLNDSSADFCDPFGFCQGTLHQFELAGGVVVRF